MVVVYTQDKAVEIMIEASTAIFDIYRAIETSSIRMELMSTLRDYGDKYSGLIGSKIKNANVPHGVKDLIKRKEIDNEKQYLGKMATHYQMMVHEAMKKDENQSFDRVGYLNALNILLQRCVDSLE